MTRASLAIATLLATLPLATLAGCSAIASRDPGPAPCDFAPPDPDPCPAPQHCVDGFCVGSCANPVAETCNGLDDDCNGMVDDDAPCTGGLCVRGECRTDCAAAELCNQRDDDCDTLVDEMLDVDSDADGYVACNVAMPSQSDCNDRDRDIHPGGTEVCNGYDDDCNPTTSDLSARCPDVGTLCAVPTGETVPRCIDPRDCRLVPCGAGQLCNADSTCCTMGTAGCGAPTDCRTSGCAGGERCTPTTSSMTWVCQPLTPLGGACATNADCASGRCFTRQSLALQGSGSVCGAPCCTDTECAAFAGSTCWAPGTGARSCVMRTELSSVDLGFTLCTNRNACPGRACVAYSLSTPAGGGGAWECAAASDQTCGLGFGCASGICEPILNAYCVNPCGSAADCSSSRPACAYVPVDGQWLTGCLAWGGRGQGEPCSTDGDCRENLCLGGFCADTCCADATCGGGTCAPVDHSGWEMRCVPRAPT